MKLFRWKGMTMALFKKAKKNKEAKKALEEMERQQHQALERLRDMSQIVGNQVKIRDLEKMD